MGDCAIIIMREGGLKNQMRGGGLSKNNAKMGGGAQIKIALITCTGGPSFILCQVHAL